MAKQMYPPGLPQAQFDALLAALKAAFETIGRRAAAAVMNLLERHANILAQCNLMQLQTIETTLHGSYGVQLHDIVRKAVLLGQNKIALHVYRNAGITWRKLIGLPSGDIRKLNNPNHVWGVVASRNKVVQVTSANLNVPQTRKLVRRWDPPKALPPSRQLDPRRKPMHTYYSLVAVEPDPVVRNAVLATFALGNSSFKSRLFVKDIAQIQAAFPANGKRKVV